MLSQEGMVAENHDYMIESYDFFNPERAGTELTRFN